MTVEGGEGRQMKRISELRNTTSQALQHSTEKEKECGVHLAACGIRGLHAGL